MSYRHISRATQYADTIAEHVETVRDAIENAKLHPAREKQILAALDAIATTTEAVREGLFDRTEVESQVDDAKTELRDKADEQVEDVRSAVERVSAAADKVLGYNWFDESRDRYELRRALRDLREVVRPAPKPNTAASPLWTHD